MTTVRPPVTTDELRRLMALMTGLAERFLGEGWRAITVEGRDHDAIEIALDAAHDDRPLAVVARVEPKDS